MMLAMNHDVRRDDTVADGDRDERLAHVRLAHTTELRLVITERIEQLVVEGILV